MTTADTWRERMRVLAEAEQRRREILVEEPPVLPILRVRDASAERSEPPEAAIVPVAPEAPAAPPALVDVDAEIARVLGLLVGGRIDTAKTRWISVAALQPRTGATWKQKLLVGELIGMTEYLQRPLVVLLASAIQNDTLTNPVALRLYACAIPKRAYIDRALVAKFAPHIAILIGDALLAEELAHIGEPGLAEAAERPSIASRFAKTGLMALFLIAVGAMVVTLIVVTSPSKREPVRQAAAMPITDEPDPVRERESWEEILMSVSHSERVLATNHWASVDYKLGDALGRRDCGEAIDHLPVLAPDAPELARRHLDAIEQRVDMLCSAEKYSPTE